MTPSGTPFVPLAKPWLGEEEASATARPILSGWVTQGPEVAAFEREFAAYVGSAYACAVANCTVALHLALRVLGVSSGDEVITASHSFIATANAIRYCEAMPVFVDIEPDTFNLDPRRLAAAITPRTRAILCVHQLGMPCDLGAILSIAREHGVPVIEDAACATGSEIRRDGHWERIGAPQGDIACFSFHPRKVVTTGDGGMLTTFDPRWDRQFRLLRQHAMDIPDVVRHGSKEVLFESYDSIGYNYRMTDIQAAVGRVQLTRLAEIIARRRALATRYRTLLAGVEELRLPFEPAWARSNWQSYCVRLPEHANQKRVMQGMLDRGVATRRGVMCSHREPAYPAGTWRCGGAHCDRADGRCGHLLESEQAQDHCIVLPLFAQMTYDEQDRVADAMRETLSEEARMAALSDTRHGD
jgi:dTDP-4-amino-4,6-dideoxygalactose transaminase